MKRHAIILLLIVCLGAALRVYDLGKKSLWLDEGSSVYYAEVLIPSMVERLVNGLSSQQIIQEWRKNQPSHPPFYFVLLHFWIAIGRDETTIRLLSALAGIVSVPVLYYLAKALFSEQVGVLGALLLATSPLHVYYSQEARMYPFITLFVLVSVYCVIGFLKTNAWVWRIGYVLCMALSLYTQYVTVFALALQNIIVLIFVWYQRDRKRLLIWLAMQMSVLLLFAPWIPFALYQVAGVNGSRLGLSLYTLLFALPLQIFMAFSLGEYSWSLPLWMTVAGLLGFLIFTLYGLLAPEPNDVSRGKYWRWVTPQVALCLVYLLFAVLGVLLLYGARPFRPARLALFGLPAYYLLVARGIERIRIGSKAKLTAVAALTVLSLFAVVTNVYQLDSQEDWRGAVNHILSEAQPEDVVVLHAYYTYKPFSYYSARQRPNFAGLVKINYPLQNVPAAVEEATKGHKRMWLVLSHATAVDPNRAVEKYVEAHYRLLEDRHFAGVDVYLYELEEGESANSHTLQTPRPNWG
jgi:mannosyltransferase